MEWRKGALEPTVSNRDMRSNFVSSVEDWVDNRGDRNPHQPAFQGDLFAARTPGLRVGFRAGWIQQLPSLWCFVMAAPANKGSGQRDPFVTPLSKNLPSRSKIQIKSLSISLLGVSTILKLTFHETAKWLWSCKCQPSRVTQWRERGAALLVTSLAQWTGLFSRIPQWSLGLRNP